MPSFHSACTSTALLGLALLAASLPTRAQGTPAALADCAAIAGDSERLACFDRLSGRAARPAAEPQGVAPAAPAATAATPGHDGTTTTVAAPAGSGSMYDKAWSFDPSTPRYDVSLYAPNYFLFGRYTNDLNTAPFDPLVGGGVLAPGTELDSTEAAFQLSFKFRLWTTDDRRWGAWAARQHSVKGYLTHEIQPPAG